MANVSQFTAKTLNKQSNKALKDEKTEKNKLKKVFPSPSFVSLIVHLDYSDNRRFNKVIRTVHGYTPRMQSGRRTKPSTCFGFRPVLTPWRAGLRRQ